MAPSQLLHSCQCTARAEEDLQSSFETETRSEGEPQARFKAALDDDSDSDSASDTSASDSPDKPTSRAATQAKKPRREEINLRDLQDAGFSVRSSILSIKEQPQDLSYEWAKERQNQYRGRGQAGANASDEEDFEERERLRDAANGATETAVHQSIEQKKKAAEQLAKERAEHAQQQKEKRESYQQREKRKRELGQQKRGTNYVEEEKRLLRQHNVYSGFD